jgi:thioredoxin-like negative regulator of GroEL
MAPIVESIAHELAGTVKIYQLDNDANPATIARLGVRGLPTMLVFRDGEVADRIIGAVPASVLRERIMRIVQS